MHLILTGATGLVGSACLRAMLASADVTRISVLSRRPVPMVEETIEKEQEPRGKEKKKEVRVLIHEDFGAYDAALLEKLRGARGCVWALGVPYRMGIGEAGRRAKEQYVKITHSWPVAAARAFATLSPRFNFVYVSGEGATHEAGYLTLFFGRTKGEAELSLLRLRGLRGDDEKQVDMNQIDHIVGLQPFSVRPGFVDAAGDEEIEPYIPRPPFLYSLSAVMLGPLIRATIPSMHSPTEMLGRMLVKLVGREGGVLDGEGVSADGRVVSAKAIWRLVDSL